MATAKPRPALQLFEQTFSEPEGDGYERLATYLSDGGSVFPLVEQGWTGLVEHYGLAEGDARLFMEKANALAIHVRRQFIEHSLFAEPGTAPGPRSGLLSIMDGPSFEKLFPMNFEALCPPDALESIHSPVAYLIDLLVLIRDKIETKGTAAKLPLHIRRSDLKPLLVDFNAVHEAVSAVDIIVGVLEQFIATHASATPALEQKLYSARYPNGLPYYQHWVTLDYVARHNGLTVGDLVQRVDPSSPWFLQPHVLDDSNALRALIHAARLGPDLRLMLTEAAHFTGSGDDAKAPEFYLRHFGALGTDWNQYKDVPFLCERTQLDSLQLEALLSVRSFAPSRSINAPRQSGEAPNIHAGSVYINAGAAMPVGIEFQTQMHRLTNVAHAHLDRLNRKVRLDRAMDLPPEDVDGLLAAAFNAVLPANTTYAITDNVLQALGLFQTLRERYGCTAADFAASINVLSFYGRGEELSLFDRVFNGNGDYRDALVLDHQPFTLLPAPGETELTVNRLCSGLGIDLLTYGVLAQAVALAHGSSNGKLPRTAAVVSSFYRLVKLPELLGITPIEGVSLLMLLGGESWLKAVAGTPRIQAHTQAAPNVLLVIHALHSCVSVCRERGIEVRWMLQQVTTPGNSQKETLAEQQLFEQVRNLLDGALFTNNELLMEGVPSLGGGASWLDMLGGLVDSDGLVVTEPDQEGEKPDYPSIARQKLLRAVKEGLGDRYASQHAAIVELMLGVLLRARAAQLSVVKECLAVYTSLASEQVIAVLTWASGRVDFFLREVLARPLPASEISPGRAWRIVEGDSFLLHLTEIRRRSEITLKLGLSTDVLRDYLDYGNRAWIPQDDPLGVTLSTFYYLMALAHAFTLSEQPQARLLDYLREVAQLPLDTTPGAPPKLSEDAWYLVREAAAARLAAFFDWSVQDVRECALAINQPVLRTLQHLDLLLRLRTLAARSGMDARTMLVIGALPVTAATVAERDHYLKAADKALLSLNETSGTVANLVTEEPVAAAVITCELVSGNVLIAKKPGEKALYKLKVTDRQGRVMKGVFIHWQTTLGTIAEKATLENGEVTVEYLPGQVQGEDTPLFWLDLGESQPAPSVSIGAQSSSFHFPPALTSEVPSGPVPVGEEVELYAVIEDNYYNRGINATVSWSARPLGAGSGTAILRYTSLTNAQGLTRAFVSSATGGRFEVKVVSTGSDESALFPGITFLPHTSAE